MVGHAPAGIAEHVDGDRTGRWGVEGEFCRKRVVSPTGVIAQGQAGIAVESVSGICAADQRVIAAGRMIEQASAGIAEKDVGRIWHACQGIIRTYLMVMQVAGNNWNSLSHDRLLREAPNTSPSSPRYPDQNTA